ncbi:alpha/beta-hydrolase [Rickenella mellea]|uniref:Alpha/beta-hydrolase n=1 Tax=Rickenella mellea TaxID=50990 RepID=A0A4Y7Q628_9AGAM|nr:alpha/beta-hydrolase [Rickenella mellea]
MTFNFRNQPLKGIYVMYAVLSVIFVRLPWWTLVSLISRPRASWTLKRAILVRLIRYFTGINDRIFTLQACPDHRAITGGKGVKGVWVEPVPNFVTGQVKEWADQANVRPVRIPGYWQDKKGYHFSVGQKPTADEKVLYLLHGGGYIALSAHPADITSNIARGILKCSSDIKRSFAIEYRLSSSAPLPVANPFPAALIDALAGYNYLVNVVGYSPSQIVIAGDSAGGNLALALTRYLVDNPIPSLPLPSGILLLSPWCDLGPSHLKPGSSVYSFANSDFLVPPNRKGMSGWSITSFVGVLSSAAAKTNIYISPASQDVASGGYEAFPPSFIVAGGAEIFYDQIVTLRKRMQADMGSEKVRYYEAKDGVHDYLILPWHEPERGQTLRAIAEWISEL